MANLNLLRKRMMKSWRSDQTGSALVEAALTAPLLTLMLLGAVEFGRIAYISIQVSNAAKAAVQYGAQNLITANDSAGILKVAQLETSGIASGNVSINLTSTCSCSSPDTTVVAFTCLDATTASCPSPSHVEQTLTVTVSSPFNPLIHAPGSTGSFNLSGRAIQKRLQ